MDPITEASPLLARTWAMMREKTRSEGGWDNWTPEQRAKGISNFSAEWLQANPDNPGMAVAVADFQRRMAQQEATRLAALSGQPVATEAAPTRTVPTNFGGLGGVTMTQAAPPPPSAPGTSFFGDIARGYADKGDRTATSMLLTTGEFSTDDLKRQLAHEYVDEQLSDTQEKPPSFIPHLIGELARTVTGTILASGAGSPVAGALWAGTIEGTAARIGSLRDNTFSSADKLEDFNTAFERSMGIATRSGALMGAASAVPLAPVVSALGKGGAVQGLIKGVANRGTLAPVLANVAEKAAETGAAKAVDAGGRKLFGSSAAALDRLLTSESTSAAAIALQSGAVKAGAAGVENTVAEGADIFQERWSGGNTSERRGSIGERLAMAGATGAGISAAHGVGAKLGDMAQGKSFLADERTAAAVNFVLTEKWKAAQGDKAATERLAKAMQTPEGEFVGAVGDAATVGNPVFDAVTRKNPGFDAEFTDTQPVGAPDAIGRAAGRLVTFFQRYGRVTSAEQAATVLHEAGHVHLDSLTPGLQGVLFDKFRAEMSTGDSPLLKGLDKNGQPVKHSWVDNQVTDFWKDSQDTSLPADERAVALNKAFREWYSERMVFHELAWAERRIKQAEDKSVFGQLLNDLSARAELVGRAMGLSDPLGYRRMVDSGPSDAPLNDTLSVVRGKLGVKPSKDARPLPETPGMPEPLEGQPYDLSPAVRGDAAVQYVRPPKAKLPLPETPGMPEPLEGQPYDLSPAKRGEAAVRNRPLPELNLRDRELPPKRAYVPPGALIGVAPKDASAEGKAMFTSPEALRAAILDETPVMAKSVLDAMPADDLARLRRENLRESLAEQSKDPLADRLPARYQERADPISRGPDIERLLLARELRAKLAEKASVAAEPVPTPAPKPAAPPAEQAARPTAKPEAEATAPVSTTPEATTPARPLPTPVTDTTGESGFSAQPRPVSPRTGEQFKLQANDPAYNYNMDLSQPMVTMGDRVSFVQSVEKVTKSGRTKVVPGPRLYGTVEGFTEGGQITVRVKEEGRTGDFFLNFNSAMRLRREATPKPEPVVAKTPTPGEQAVAAAGEKLARGEAVSYDEKLALADALRAEVQGKALARRGALDDLSTRKAGQTEEAQTLFNDEQDLGRNLPQRTFRVEPATSGTRFHAALAETARVHRLGAAVEVKSPEFYRDAGTKLFLEHAEGSDPVGAGAAVTADRDLVSVFKHPNSVADIRPILREASRHAQTLDAFDVNGFLPSLYSEFGFRPVARVPFNENVAPRDWPYALAGKPDVVLMVKDPDVTSRQDYAELRKTVPLFKDYDDAANVQREARAELRAKHGADYTKRQFTPEDQTRLDQLEAIIDADMASSKQAKEYKALLAAKKAAQPKEVVENNRLGWTDRRNGWLLPDGSFIETDPAEALDFRPHGLRPGSHGATALDWLKKNDPQAFRAFRTVPRDGEVESEMFRRGWVRIAQGGGVNYLQGKPNATQERILSEWATETAQTEAQPITWSRVSNDNVVRLNTQGQLTSGAFRALLGQEEGYLSRRVTEPRDFPERAGKAEPELGRINAARPDIQFYEPQSIADGVAAAGGKADAALDASVTQLKSKVENDTLHNFLVLDGLERMRRALDAGDTTTATEVYDTLSKAGTTLGQLLRQFAEFRTPKTPENMVSFVELALAQRGLKLQPGQQTRLRGLVDAAETARTAYETAAEAALNNPAATEKDFRVVDKLEREAGQAEREWRRYAQVMFPRESASRDFLAVIQGNLLTPKSTLRNFWHNYATGAVRLPARQLGAAVDAAVSAVQGRERSLSGVSVTEAQWFARATADAVPTAGEILLRGGGGPDVVGERIRGFHPVDALMRAFNGDLPVDTVTGEVPLKLRGQKLAEAFFGAAPEPMLRSLAAMDELAKAGFRASRLAQEAQLAGAKPGSREYAEARLRATGELRAKAEETALAGAFQQDSAASQGAAAVEGIVRKVAGEPGAVAFRLLTSPYVKTPVNVAVETVSYAVPSVAAAQAVFYARQGNRREAALAVGKFLTGLTLSAAADWLLQDGLISGGPEQNRNAELLRKSSDMEFYRLNVDGLKRRLAGGSGRYVDGDTTYRLDLLGVPGVVLGVRADMANLAEQAAPNRVPSEQAQKFNLEVFSELLGMTRFMVDTTMMQNVGNTLRALVTGDVNRVVQNVASEVAVVRPDWANTVTSFRTAQRGVVPDVSDRDIPTMLRNVVAWKSGEWNDLPKKLDLWGNPVKPVPEGADPYLHVLADIRQPKTGQDRATTVLQNAYAATRDDRVIPSWPSRNLEYKDLPKGLYLPAHLYQSYVHDVMQAKRDVLGLLLQDAEFMAAPANVQVKSLDRAYDRAGNRAGLAWRGRHFTELEAEREKLKAWQARER